MSGLRYLSVCSGIEAATVAWHGLGWIPAGFSEIEPFPSAVLKHHYPHVPNLGDMTNFKEWDIETIDLLVGGTPCQSFSVAGLRKGLHDPRGGLMLTFLEIAQRYRPRWVVWENVPGCLSSDRGRDFGTFLGALGELGYGWAYRVLDSRWFGVAQKRRRVFVVGCLGDQASAAAVLFESESVSRNPAARKQTRKDTTGSTGDGVARCVTAGEMKRQDWETCNFVAQPATFAKTHKPMSNTDPEGWSPVEASPTLTHWPRDRSDGGTDVAVVQPIAFHHNAQACQLPTESRDTSVSDSLTTSQGAAVALAFKVRGGVEVDSGGKAAGKGYLGSEETAFTLAATQDQWLAAPPAMQVRRLTPVECERLQGFPDGYTNIPWRKKDEAPDGPRYKALGNSMAVPCMRWIGERIAQCDSATTKS